NGFSGDTIEDVHERLFRDLGDGFDTPSIDSDVNQVGCRRRVVVPQPVAYELVVPDLLAGRSLDADEAVAIETVSQAVPTVIVVGRCANREIDVAKLFVRAHGRPDVGVAGLLPGVVLPGLDA